MNPLSRLKLLQAKLKEESYGAFIINDPLDLFYISGLNISSGELWVTPESAAWRVDGRYTDLCRSKSPFQVYEAPRYSIQDLLNEPFLASLHQIGFDETATNYKSFESLQKALLTLQGRSLSLDPVLSPVKKLRAIKEVFEHEKMQDAASLGARGLEYGISLLKTGITERAIAKAIERFWIEEGGDKPAFEIIVAFGPHSALPHHRPDDTPLKPNQIVLIDLGVQLKGYCSDLTRTFFFGTPHPQLWDAWHTVYEAQQAAIKKCHAGNRAGEVDFAARSHIEDAGYPLAFKHSVGHSLGLEVHEWPTLRSIEPAASTILKEGMILAIEPGIYIPELGGIRIEDTILISSKGAHKLINIPCEPLVIAVSNQSKF